MIKCLFIRLSPNHCQPVDSGLGNWLRVCAAQVAYP